MSKVDFVECEKILPTKNLIHVGLVVMRYNDLDFPSIGGVNAFAICRLCELTNTNPRNYCFIQIWTTNIIKYNRTCLVMTIISLMRLKGTLCSRDKFTWLKLTNI